MGRVEHHMALVGGWRAQHAEERQLRALDREGGVVSPVDHQHGSGQARSEVDLIQARGRMFVLEESTIQKDDRLQTAFERRQDHPVGRALADAQITKPRGVDVGPLFQVVDRPSEILRPVDDQLARQGRTRKRR